MFHVPCFFLVGYQCFYLYDFLNIKYIYHLSNDAHILLVCYLPLMLLILAHEIFNLYVVKYTGLILCQLFYIIFKFYFILHLKISESWSTVTNMFFQFQMVWFSTLNYLSYLILLKSIRKWCILMVFKYYI